jgi:hypothetical protein
MLRIRKEQMKALDEYMVQSFQNLVFIHLTRVFPIQCQEIGESEVHASIKKGIELAANYKITSQIDVVGFIDLMYVHNWDLDRNIPPPWASYILMDPDLHPSRKMKKLYEITEQQLGFSCKNP